MTKTETVEGRFRLRVGSAGVVADTELEIGDAVIVGADRAVDMPITGIEIIIVPGQTPRVRIDCIAFDLEALLEHAQVELRTPEEEPARPPVTSPSHPTCDTLGCETIVPAAGDLCPSCLA